MPGREQVALINRCLLFEELYFGVWEDGAGEMAAQVLLAQSQHLCTCNVFISSG